MRKPRLRLMVPLAAGAVLAGSLGRGYFPSAQADTPPSETTSAAEAKRVDNAPATAPAWADCPKSWTDLPPGNTAPAPQRTDKPRCATVEVPLDYDEPQGKTVKIALMKWSALKPTQKIGSLLLNPGGPGGSGIQTAAAVETEISENLQNRFDVVGFDPRGIGKSTQMRCFTDTAAKDKALNRAEIKYPYTEKHIQDRLYLAETMGRACSTTGKELASSMSTAEVARDMDVLRRILGDEKLSYYGTSYGSVLGQYYANMFPDRFRAIAIDGISNPQNLVGTAETANVPIGIRDGSGQAHNRAMKEALKRCKAAGTSRCTFGAGNPEAAFETLLERLKKKPVTVQQPNGEPRTLDYEWVLDTMDTALRQAPAYLEQMMQNLAKLEKMTDPTADDSAAERRAGQKALATAVDDMVEMQKKNPDIRSLAEASDDYDTTYEAHYAVICTDGKHAGSLKSWPDAAAAAERQASYGGTTWAWGSAPCARNVWTALDEDAYTGPFNRNTAAPVLILGNTWDPASNHDNAIAVAKLLPNSRLLDSDSWGHCAYHSSACTKNAMDKYLITGIPPAAGTTCHGDFQPFEGTATPTRTS